MKGGKNLEILNIQNKRLIYDLGLREVTILWRFYLLYWFCFLLLERLYLVCLGK